MRLQKRHILGSKDLFSSMRPDVVDDEPSPVDKTKSSGDFLPPIDIGPRKAREKKLIFETFQETRERRALERWERQQQEWSEMEIKLSSKLGKNPNELVMESGDQYRAKLEEIDLIEHSAPSNLRTTISWESSLRGGAEGLGVRYVSIGGSWPYPLYCPVKLRPTSQFETIRKPSIHPIRTSSIGVRNKELAYATKKYGKYIDKYLNHDPITSIGDLVVHGGNPQLADGGLRPETDQQIPRSARALQPEMSNSQINESGYEPTEDIEQSASQQLVPDITGPAYEMSSDSLLFTSDIHDVVIAKVVVQNVGSAKLDFVWRKLPPLNELQGHRSERKFSLCSLAEGFLLPGAECEFYFSFSSPTYGIYIDQWEFVTVPVIPDSQRILRLRAVVTSEEEAIDSDTTTEEVTDQQTVSKHQEDTSQPECEIQGSKVSTYIEINKESGPYVAMDDLSIFTQVNKDLKRSITCDKVAVASFVALSNCITDILHEQEKNTERTQPSVTPTTAVQPSAPTPVKKGKHDTKFGAMDADGSSTGRSSTQSILQLIADTMPSEPIRWDLAADSLRQFGMQVADPKKREELLYLCSIVMKGANNPKKALSDTKPGADIAAEFRSNIAYSFCYDALMSCIDQVSDTCGFLMQRNGIAYGSIPSLIRAESGSDGNVTPQLPPSTPIAGGAASTRLPTTPLAGTISTPTSKGAPKSAQAAVKKAGVEEIRRYRQQSFQQCKQFVLNAIDRFDQCTHDSNDLLQKHEIVEKMISQKTV